MDAGSGTSPTRKPRTAYSSEGEFPPHAWEAINCAPARYEPPRWIRFRVMGSPSSVHCSTFPPWSKVPYGPGEADYDSRAAGTGRGQQQEHRQERPQTPKTCFVSV